MSNVFEEEIEVALLSNGDFYKCLIVDTGLNRRIE